MESQRTGGSAGNAHPDCWEREMDGNSYVPAYQAHADDSVRLDIEPDAEEEAADFARQVRECLNHWPGITPVDLDA